MKMETYASIEVEKSVARMFSRDQDGTESANSGLSERCLIKCGGGGGANS